VSDEVRDSYLKPSSIDSTTKPVRDVLRADKRESAVTPGPPSLLVVAS
jgi:hypothetical protein